MPEHASPTDPSKSNLRRGWTTGACASAAAKAACIALLTNVFPDRVRITLPNGQRPAFTLQLREGGAGFARAGVEKDAGDDPDVTHGALIIATLRRGRIGAGIRFFAGEGVGQVTRPGLAIPPGEAAINPVPREMIGQAIGEAVAAHGGQLDFDVEITVPGGRALAEKTLNGRLGIVGGISILGTTGIVKPYSCAAWIASIHRGIDVARAGGLDHVAAATGSTSERVAQAHLRLPEEAMLDMGDFVGGTLKYLRTHPVPRVTIAGGFAKISKLSQGAADLHSRRSRVDIAAICRILEAAGMAAGPLAALRQAANAGDMLRISADEAVDAAGPVAVQARASARSMLRDAPVRVSVLVVDRSGAILAETSAL